MVLRQPEKWIQFALIATLLSVIGGIFGYMIGWFFWDIAQSWVERIGWTPRYDQAVMLIREWGIWIVFVAGFTPLPYKVMTIAAGTLSTAWPLEGSNLSFMAHVI